MSDYRFIKISHTFPEHWKTMDLTDRAFRQLVTAWCYCARNGTDGKLSKAQAREKFTRQTVSELLAVGYLHETDAGYQMHQFDEHQMTAAEYDDLHVKRSEAGRKGGLAKANRVASASPVAKQTAKQTPSKPVAEVEVEVEVEKDEAAQGASTPANTPRGTRVARDFQVSDSMRSWASEHTPGVDVQTSTLRFHNYWLSKTGKDATKLDWVKTWQNWLLSDHERLQKVRPVNSRRQYTAEGERAGIYG